MLKQHTCCIILPTRIVVGRQFLGGLDLCFCSGVCRREFVEISALNNKMPHNTKHFFASMPVGNRVGSSPAVQSEWNLRLSQFSSLWTKPHSAYLISRCITSDIRFCWVWKTALFFCCGCEIMQTPNLQSSSRSVALRACWAQIAHTSTVLLVGSLGGTKQKKGPYLISIPKAQSLLLSGFFPPSLPVFDFCSSPGLCLIHPCSPFYCNSFLLPSIQPVTPWLCFQANWERASARQGVEAGGEIDKATSVSDTNMAQSQHQYYVCAPSFFASHRVIDPPPHHALFPFPVQVCPLPALTLSKLLFWLKR